ncbi:MAG TPA: hypothetical protein VLE02_01405 [Nitrosarchaeum sp.]|nr:hypothetical protein [Nitrosarchaeum sp.]
MIHTLVRENGIVVVMRGTVGCGKSYLSIMLRDAIMRKGGYCVVANTSKYLNLGLSVDDARKKVQNDLLTVNRIPQDKQVVVIIDSTDQKFNKKTTYFFDINFDNWVYYTLFPSFNKNNKEGYLKWSLMNVLQRRECVEGDTYVTNPITYSLRNCLTTHHNISRQLFGKNTVKCMKDVYASKYITEAVEKLAYEAASYALDVERINEKIVVSFLNEI